MEFVKLGKLDQIIAINYHQQLQISINDHGSGIPESVKPRIFEPFYTTKPIGISQNPILLTSRVNAIPFPPLVRDNV
ncbi:MAG: hypothetical protein EAZ77_09235 [Nostocales cyanobacterium]|nr:MAG: hypothetical protein EAZ77_09235 [Nostocales cyanobacterium]